MTFEEFASTENSHFLSLQERETEVVSECDNVLALSVLSHANIETVGDCYLYCAAANLISTYVKQHKLKDYRFKRNIEYFLASVEYYEPELVKISCQNSQGVPLLIVNISSLQFSFHSVKIPLNLSLLFSQSVDSRDANVWDGIRKQHCAVSVFYSALNAKWFRSDTTVKGKSLSTIIVSEQSRWMSKSGKG